MAKAKRVTGVSLREMKAAGQPIAMLTAYDYYSAQVLDEIGIDILLVGDSLSMVFAGHDTTLPATMDQMLYHTGIVARACKRAMVVGDMPFMSYQVTAIDALNNAGRFVKEADAQAVKLEGGRAMVPTIKRIVQAGIPVMGHVGLTPQSVYKFGGYQLQGATPEDAQRILDCTRALEDVGIFGLVLEKVPADLGRRVAEALTVPVIGIGAGPHVDGQVLVQDDILGMFPKFKSKFVKVYGELGQNRREAFEKYIDDVRQRRFPGDEHSYEGT